MTCVLIFLDGARFIDEAIRSVVDQRGDVGWELVLVDDGSTDASTAIARGWADRDPRIRYVQHAGHANLGMSASRNAGVAVARGTYIGFLDCDDVWLPSALANGMRVFRAHPDADAVVGGTWRWHSWTGDPADVRYDHRMSVPDAPPHTVVPPPLLFEGMYGTPGGWRIPAMCSLLVTRAALLDVGGLDERFRGLYEDQVLYAKLALHLRIVVDPRPMGLYRQHGASACQVAADAGEWRRMGPNALEQRYLEWLRTYVLGAGGPPGPMAVVARNLEHAARGEHVARPPGVASAALRRHLPEPARRVLRRLRARLRQRVRLPSVVAVWSEAFLAPGAVEPGPTLVVEGRQRGERWVDTVPSDALAGGVTRQSLAHARADRATCDRIVVTYGAAAALATAELIAVLARRLGPCGSAAAIMPGPAVDPRRPAADAVAGIVRDALPHHDLVIESFGNAATARAVAAGEPAAAVGALVDRHDPAVPVALGVLITGRHAPSPDVQPVRG